MYLEKKNKLLIVNNIIVELIKIVILSAKTKIYYYSAVSKLQAKVNFMEK